MTVSTRLNLNELEREYYDWLVEMYILPTEYWNTYKDVVFWLYTIDFYSVVTGDDNRISDAMRLRDEFGIQLDKPCSILELLIGIAMRMDFFMWNEDVGPKVSKWFWMMFRNLKLEASVGNDSLQLRNEAIIKRFLERRYSKTGEGGLFPLKRTSNDQRNTEIWYQMNSYINNVLMS